MGKIVFLNRLEREGCALFPLLQHALANVCEVLMFFHISTHFIRGGTNCVRDALQDSSNLRRGAADSCFTEALEVFCGWPPGASVECQRHAVSGQVNGGCNQVVDGR